MTTRNPKPRPASEVVREAIRASGLPIRELSRRTEVEPSVLSRFMNEQVGISLSTFEKLAPELGLRVVVDVPSDAISPGPSEKLATEVPAVTGRKTAGRKRREP